MKINACESKGSCQVFFKGWAKSHREHFSLVCFLERALVLQDTEKSHSVYKCHCSMKTLPDFLILERRRRQLGYHSLWRIKMLFSLLFSLSLVKSRKCFWNYKSSLLSMHAFIRKYHKSIHIDKTCKHHELLCAWQLFKMDIQMKE